MKEVTINFAYSEQAQKNFAEWFSKEGFDLFVKSKFNKLRKGNSDSFITCLSADEETSNGHYYELE
jgi:hypothetical protein